jgi:hypothetical protein
MASALSIMFQEGVMGYDETRNLMICSKEQMRIVEHDVPSLPEWQQVLGPEARPSGGSACILLGGGHCQG